MWEFWRLEPMNPLDQHGGGARWVEDTRRDLQHTFRVLARNPGFAVVVVLTLGLGIGAATAVFSVVNAVVLRPLNAPHADRLVRSVSVYNGRTTDMPTAYTLKAWMNLPDLFEDVSAHRLDSLPLMGTSEPEQISVGRVSAPFFRLFGASVIAGRTFSPEKDRSNAPAVVVLSYGLWVRRFGADTNM
jgi:putative ABC transport system permease protein